jgi:MSHA pilin protein MshA
MKRNQAGFTLIELIIVIVILGILAVTAAPKFLDFGGDARKSVLQGVKGSLESASSLIYGKAIIAGKQGAATDTLTDPAINIAYGYPVATDVALKVAAELTDFQFSTPAAAGDPIRIAAEAAGLVTATACYVEYAQSAGPAAKPVITIVSTEC